MPVHDWTRVDAGIFHDFHLAWTVELQRLLNTQWEEADFYALVELLPGMMTRDPFSGDPPATREERAVYARKQRTITIRHSSTHRVIALIEILSPGNKSSQHAIHALLTKARSALTQRIHLLLIDLHPP